MRAKCRCLNYTSIVFDSVLMMSCPVCAWYRYPSLVFAAATWLSHDHEHHSLSDSKLVLPDLLACKVSSSAPLHFDRVGPSFFRLVTDAAEVTASYKNTKGSPFRQAYLCMRRVFCFTNHVHTRHEFSDRLW